MPKKIRELKKILRRSGFTQVQGKGSHIHYIHPRYPGKVTLAGKDGADAKKYQEQNVFEAIRTVEGEGNNE